jgi:hypothetical protein
VLTERAPPVPVELEGKRVVWGFELCDALFEHALVDLADGLAPGHEHLVTDSYYIEQVRFDTIQSHCRDLGIGSCAYYYSHQLYRRPPGSSNHDIVFFATRTKRTVPEKRLIDKLKALLNTTIEPRWIVA